MDINENGFIQDIPSGLEPYKLESKQAQELLRLIDVHDDTIFSIALSQSIDDEENNFSHIEFTRTTFHFYLVCSGIHELHTLMNK